MVGVELKPVPIEGGNWLEDKPNRVGVELKPVPIKGGRRFLVVFDKRREGMGWRPHHIFTTKQYNHVYLLAEMDKHKTLLIKPTMKCLHIDTWDCNLALAGEHVKHYGVSNILEYTCDYEAHSGYIFRGFYTCVSVVKNFLNIKSFYTLTPIQLEHELYKLGAKKF